MVGGGEGSALTKIFLCVLYAVFMLVVKTHPEQQARRRRVPDTKST